MSMFITSLNSGSNGNCYYAGNGDEAVLIDAGISCRETEKRMKRLGLSVKNIKAVFISHEHNDHINGVASFSNKHNIPVYTTEATLKNCRLNIRKELIRFFSSNERISIGKLVVKAFPKFHDACDPHSFIVQNDDGVCIGIFTDIGKACDQIIYHFKQCNAVFLEANYDETMLETGSYPYVLKRRIRSDSGHLSNDAALDLFITHRSDKLSYLILSHLSKNNNSPELVKKLFTAHAGETKIIVADRYRETEVYYVEGTAQEQLKIYFVNSVQLTMF